MPQIKRDVGAAGYFIPWGKSGVIKLLAGSAATMPTQPLQLLQAEAPTPAVWAVCITASADPTKLGGMTAAVSFTLTPGVGSTTTTLSRALVLTPAAPSADAQLILPAQSLLGVVVATPNIPALRDVDISVAALVTPFSPKSYQVGT